MSLAGPTVGSTVIHFGILDWAVSACFGPSISISFVVDFSAASNASCSARVWSR